MRNALKRNCPNPLMHVQAVGERARESPHMGSLSLAVEGTSVHAGQMLAIDRPR